jgi:hypothetical protein
MYVLSLYLCVHEYVIYAVLYEALLIAQTHYLGSDDIDVRDGTHSSPRPAHDSFERFLLVSPGWTNRRKTNLFISPCLQSKDVRLTLQLWHGTRE